MKPQFGRVAVLTALALTSPLLSLAGSQPAKVHVVSKSEMQNRTDITRAVQQGKGSVVTRASVPVQSGAPRTNSSDAAFRK
jgi:hypothetical protein